MVLPPNMRGEQVVEGSNGSAPGNILARVKPLGMLVELRVYDVDKRLVAGEQAVATTEEVSF